MERAMSPCRTDGSVVVVVTTTSVFEGDQVHGVLWEDTSDWPNTHPTATHSGFTCWSEHDEDMPDALSVDNRKLVCIHCFLDDHPEAGELWTARARTSIATRTPPHMASRARTPSTNTTSNDGARMPLDGRSARRNQSGRSHVTCASPRVYAFF
jgi:hypothetical protein